MLAEVLTWTVHTDVFDGPLDLLLYLVKRDGIDIREVSMTGIADSYLAFLDTMRTLNIGLASDYLVMAATLCHLKSLELLPRPPVIAEEEGEDPREALARKLEDYERFKLASEALDARPQLDRQVFARAPVDTGDVDRPMIPGTDAFGLLEAYYRVLTRAEAPPPTHTIHRPEVDLETCCRHVLGALGGVGGKGFLLPILRGLKSRAERVIAFIAVLEMTRMGLLELNQPEHLAPVEVTALVAVDVDLGAIQTRVEESVG